MKTMLTSWKYTQGFQVDKNPYEILAGIRTIEPVDLVIKKWLSNTYGVDLLYVFRGKSYLIEHGHYIYGVILYFHEDARKLHDWDIIRRKLYERFPFIGLDTPDHKCMGLYKENGVSIVFVEEKLRDLVISYLYWDIWMPFAEEHEASLRMEQRQTENGAVCCDLRILFSAENRMKEELLEGLQERFQHVIEQSIQNNNYYYILDNMDTKLEILYE